MSTRRHRGKGTTFTHDGRNRLIKAVKADGTAIHYGYTPSGYRIEAVKNPSSISPNGMPMGGTRTRTVLSGSEEVADMDANKAALRYFIPGAAIDERVAQVDANGAVTFIHNDKQNSVIAISDTAGNPVVRRGYGVYGETDAAQMTLAAPGTTPHPFGYTGRRWDPDLGLYYYRARWYDPALGTFLQTDPIGSLDYINLYSYVGLEPGNGTDPSGMCPFCLAVVPAAAPEAVPVITGVTVLAAGVLTKYYLDTYPIIFPAPSPVETSRNGNSPPPSARPRSSSASAAVPPPNDPNDRNLSPTERANRMEANARNYEARASRHFRDAQNMRDNPTVKPEMLGRTSPAQQAAQQQRRIEILERDGKMFQERADKLREAAQRLRGS
jgi:RHS repeat-associated protein